MDLGIVARSFEELGFHFFLRGGWLEVWRVHKVKPVTIIRIPKVLKPQNPKLKMPSLNRNPKPRMHEPHNPIKPLNPKTQSPKL